jgi:hypothetical protein
VNYADSQSRDEGKQKMQGTHSVYFIGYYGKALDERLKKWCDIYIARPEHINRIVIYHQYILASSNSVLKIKYDIRYTVLKYTVNI